ncbi:MAG: hypothetical protein L0K86_15940 [Actinomycetia bacterium]|nr:hypothetical protein [Actinomycetes bacterium]
MTGPAPSSWPSRLRQTYSILRPPGPGFWRSATCGEAGCGAYLHGWTTTLAADDGRGDYIRRHSGRRFTEDRTPDGMVVFTFAAGQPCFRAGEHQVPIEREPLYVVRGGDARAWTGQRRVHRDAVDWRDDFGENQQILADRQAQG